MDLVDQVRPRVTVAGGVGGLGTIMCVAGWVACVGLGWLQWCSCGDLMQVLSFRSSCPGGAGGERRSHAVVEQAERQSSSRGVTCADRSAVRMQ